MNVPVSSRVVQWRKTEDLRELRNYKKISENLGNDENSPAGDPNVKFWQLCKKFEKTLLKNLLKKHWFYVIYGLVWENVRKHIFISNSAKTPCNLNFL